MRVTQIVRLRTNTSPDAFIAQLNPKETIPMKKSILTAAIFAATASVAFAQAPSSKDDSSLPAKAMEDQPGTTGGSTDMPKAKPSDSSLATKAMKDQPGTTTGGGTAAPTATPTALHHRMTTMEAYRVWG